MDNNILLPIGFEFNSPNRAIYSYDDVYNYLLPLNNNDNNLTQEKILKSWLENNNVIIIKLSKPIVPENQINVLLDDIKKHQNLLKMLEDMENEQE